MASGPFFISYASVWTRKTAEREDPEPSCGLASDPATRPGNIDKKQLEKFARDFTVIYNKAYAGHG